MVSYLNLKVQLSKTDWAEINVRFLIVTPPGHCVISVFQSVERCVDFFLNHIIKYCAFRENLFVDVQ